MKAWYIMNFAQAKGRHQNILLAQSPRACFEQGPKPSIQDPKQPRVVLCEPQATMSQTLGCYVLIPGSLGSFYPNPWATLSQAPSSLRSLTLAPKPLLVMGLQPLVVLGLKSSQVPSYLSQLSQASCIHLAIK